MIIDLHTHTQEHSDCSIQTAGDLVRRAIDIGLDGIAITDHDYLWNEADLKAALKEVDPLPLIVLRGQEVSCSDGHLLIYGIADRIPVTSTRAEVAEWVRGRGGATVIAHPFRWSGFSGLPDTEVAEVLTCFDAVEGWTSNHGRAEQERARRLGSSSNIRLIGASDAHSPGVVGCYATRFERIIASESELVQALRSGRFVAMYRDPSVGYFRLPNTDPDFPFNGQESP